MQVDVNSILAIVGEQTVKIALLENQVKDRDRTIAQLNAELQKNVDKQIDDIVNPPGSDPN